MRFPPQWCIALLLVTAVPAFAQTPPPVMIVQTPPDFPRGKISGYIFADYYDNLVGDPHHGYNATGADSGQASIDGVKPITKDLSGILIRRVYFQLDNDLSAKYSTRFRLEADSKSLASDGKIGVAVKNAYMLVRSLIPRGDFYFGLMSTPMFETSEDVWGYRSIEKTIADFRGLSPSADLGLELKGFVDGDHILGYSAMLGNGNGQKTETNMDKRSYLALPIHWKDLHLEPYVDYENVYSHQDRATYQFLAGYDLWKGTIGWEIAQQVKHHPTGPTNDAVGNSVFARVAPTANLAGFVRVDFWQPDRHAANRVDQQLWMAGLDYQPIKDVHFMPNVEATQYEAVGTGVVPPHHDLQARLTLYWKFSKPQ